MNRSSFLALGATVLATLSAGTAQAQPQQISILTSVAGSSWYAMGAGMANIFAAEGVAANAELGAGFSNIANVARGEGELGYTMSLAVSMAENGDAPFNTPLENIRGIAALAPSYAHIVARSESGVTSISDFAGRSFASQPGGTVSGEVFRRLLAADGLTEGDLDVSHGSLDYQIDYMKDRRTDGMISVGTFPAGFLMELASTLPIRFVGISDETFEALRADLPAIARATIPAGTYAGQEEAVDTFATSMVIIARAELSDDDAYWITRTLVENLDEVRALHASFADLTPEGLADMPGMTLHPGAERYYREAGLIE